MENTETPKRQGKLLKRYAMHIAMCPICQRCLATRGQFKPCAAGARLGTEWLEFQAGNGDQGAAMYLQGIEEAKNMGA